MCPKLRPHQPSPAGSVSATPPRGESEWTPERARAYLDSMDDDIMALFPDSFEDSELGKIPKGWEVKPFARTVEVRGGGTPKTSVADYWDGDIPWFTVVDAPTEHDVWVVDTQRKITPCRTTKFIGASPSREDHGDFS